MINNYLRKRLSRALTNQDTHILTNQVPSFDLIAEKFRDIEKFGLYLHIPFCNQICPYCPYNKEIYSEKACNGYVEALLKEIDIYASIVGTKPITSFYIGGGTPTVMLNKGIDIILNHIYKHFNMQCSIHMESHPNHLTAENLSTMESMGVKYLSIGVEALQDKHLKTLQRPYSVTTVKKAIELAVSRNFECVNIDYIFDLPGQTAKETEQAAHDIVSLGVDQVATYPLFRFPYTKFGQEFTENRNALSTMFRRRRFMKVLENVFYDSGFERTSVWAFTKKGTEKYCSVTVPLYLGLGASGSTYLKDVFYVNTFDVSSYINAMKVGKLPIALSMNLTKEMQMAGWLYWRLYETKFRKSDFTIRFNTDFTKQYGGIINKLQLMGFLHNYNDVITLTDKGTYWIHAFEDFFSIDYITKLWGSSKSNPWPEKVIL